MVEGECIHIGNLIPKTALLSQKEALRESNFKRYGMVEGNFKKYGVYT